MDRDFMESEAPRIEKSPLRCSSLHAARQLQFSLRKPCDNIEVFLRIKPMNVVAVDDHINESHFAIEKNNLKTKYKRAREEVISKYEFVKIFVPSTPQNVIYTRVILPKLEQFLLGNDSLVFSYGTSNSGKSYTVQGTASAPGIIPRFLYSLFESTMNCLDPEPRLYPCRSHDVQLQTNEDVAAFEKEKRRLLETIYDDIETINDSIGSAEVSAMSTKFSPCPFMLSEDNTLVSIFISFAEVYMEKVYDLLVDPSQKKSLTLNEDENKNSFIKGLTYYNVSSWEEAFTLYKYGRKNLQLFPTALNARSSRSHGIFSIKLVKRPMDSPEEYLGVSTFTICDLAGTERADATLNVGVRLAESKNINVSLLTLHRCFKALKSNQMKSENIAPPFRESKLTSLLKKFLLGHGGKITMIANISQDSSIFQETSHILKVSALVYKTKITNCVPKENARVLKQRFSMYRSQAGKANQKGTTPAGEFVAPLPAAAIPCSNCKVVEQEMSALTTTNEDLLEANIGLKNEILHLKAQLKQTNDGEKEYKDALTAYQKNHLLKIGKFRAQLGRIAKAAGIEISDNDSSDSVTEEVINKLENKAFVESLAVEEISELKSEMKILMVENQNLRDTIESLKGENLEQKSQIEELNALLAAKAELPSKDARDIEEEEEEDGKCLAENEESKVVPMRKAKQRKNYAECFLAESSPDDSDEPYVLRSRQKSKKGTAHNATRDNPKQLRPLSVRKMRKKKNDFELPNLGHLSFSDSSLPTTCHSEPPKSIRRKLLQKADTKTEKTFSENDDMEEELVINPADIIRRKKGGGKF